MPDNEDRTAAIRRQYDRTSDSYDFYMGLAERILGRWRARLWRDARGRILEVGVGTGLNLPYYPPGSEVTAVDLSPGMLARARQRAAALGMSVDLRLGDAEHLEFPDASFDTVVATLVFCSVPDPVRGLREVRRVCRPGGRVLLLEHMRSDRPVVGWLLDVLNPMALRMGGENINRRTLDNIRAAGLEIVEVENLWSDIFRRIVATPATSDQGGPSSGG